MKMNKTKIIQLIINMVAIVLLIVGDQYTKSLAVTSLKDQPAFILYEGVFELSYLENRGAAFGMMQNQKSFFILIAAIILFVIAYILYKVPKHKKYIWLQMMLCMLAAGAVGNMLDRIRLNYVVDFLYFSLIDFPIFNVADCYVTVSCVLMVILLLFVYKESDLEFLNLRQKKVRAPKE